MKHGIIRVASAIPLVRVADAEYNGKQIAESIINADSQGAEIIVFPELSITGYSCQDLFLQQRLLSDAEKAITSLLSATRKTDIIAILGVPVACEGQLFNTAAVVQHGRILSLVAKTFLSNHGEGGESRWFASATANMEKSLTYAGQQTALCGADTVFHHSGGAIFSVEIGDDLWVPTPPSNQQALHGATLVFNLSASSEVIGKNQYLHSLLQSQSARLRAAYIYSSAGFGESTQDVVYGGNAIIYVNGCLTNESERFSMVSQTVISDIDVEQLECERLKDTSYRLASLQLTDCKHTYCENPINGYSSHPSLLSVNPYPFVPEETKRAQTCEDVLNIQSMGLVKRLVHTHCQHAVIGISGGLDSTLTLLVAVRAFDRLGIDRKNIIGITMPGFGTTDRTHDNAIDLMKHLGITPREIPIAEAVKVHFADIGHNIDNHDVTYENAQARERTQILMDVANQTGGMVIGTGDMSELALGWATYNGDHMSMYGVNASVPKTLIRHVVKYAAETLYDDKIKQILLDIVETPISPELTPANADGTIRQKTEDLIGPYELHDFFLYYTIKYGFSPEKIEFLASIAFEKIFNKDTIKRWLNVFYNRFFSQQFKRSCLPDGPKVSSISLSPRGDWRMPSDAVKWDLDNEK